MDPLSIIASTIAVIEAVSSIYRAIQHSRGLPKEFTEVNRNLPLMQNTLSLARDHLKGVTLDKSSKTALGSVISSCEEKAKMLQNIFERVKREAEDGSGGSMLELYRTSLLRLGKTHRVESLMQGILRGLNLLASNTAARIQIPVDQLEKAIKNLSVIESCVPDSEFENGTNSQHIATGGTGYQSNLYRQDHKVNSGSGRQFVAHSMTFVQSNTQSDILQTLHTSLYLDRMKRNPEQVPGTCEWFTGHGHFRKWRENSTSSLLWVTADPGCGKSVLARYLVESELPSATYRTTCYFFFKADYEDQRSARSALCCILHQLFNQRKDLLTNRIYNRLKANKKHLTDSFDELWEILIMASKENNSGELICVLDAFDECEPRERDKLGQALSKLYGAMNCSGLKFLVTSRPYAVIECQISHPIIHLKGDSQEEVSKITQEINLFIENRVSRLRKRLDLESEEVRLLLDKLRRVPHRTYIWVHLTLEDIEHDISIDKKKDTQDHFLTSANRR